MVKRLSKSFCALKEKVATKYPTLPEHRLVAELRRINQIVDNARDLVGMRIMDLGCGSVQSPDAPQGRVIRFLLKHLKRDELERFDPWYCRVLDEAGAHAIGIDIGDNSEELFETHSIDLFQPEALKQFADGSIDAVNNLCFTVPPESRRAEKGTSPHIMNNWMKGFQPTQEDLKEAWAFDRSIRTQVNRVLKNYGVYVQSEFVFEKRNGKLHHRNTMDGLGS